MHYTLCLFSEELPRPKKYLQGASVKLQRAELAEEEPGKMLWWQSTSDIAPVLSPRQQLPGCCADGPTAGRCSQRSKDQFSSCFTHK